MAEIKKIIGQLKAALNGKAEKYLATSLGI